ncbi:MAG: hypothetical protein P1V51_02565 [Deltaproteobacteria bacterium]|nr:hypothetical protein [Deltaproteobacteria bacterium]
MAPPAPLPAARIAEAARLLARANLDEVRVPGTGVTDWAMVRPADMTPGAP